MRVLLVEDDPGLAAIIKTGFAEHGVQVVTVANYADGQMKAVLGTFDAHPSLNNSRPPPVEDFRQTACGAGSRHDKRMRMIFRFSSHEAFDNE